MHTLVEATGQPLVCSPGASSFFLQVCGMHVYMRACVCVLITADLYTCVWRNKVDTENCSELVFHFPYQVRVSQSNPELPDMASVTTQLVLQIPHL